MATKIADTVLNTFTNERFCVPRESHLQRNISFLLETDPVEDPVLTISWYPLNTPTFKKIKYPNGNVRYSYDFTYPAARMTYNDLFINFSVANDERVSVTFSCENLVLKRGELLDLVGCRGDTSAFIDKYENVYESGFCRPGRYYKCDKKNKVRSLERFMAQFEEIDNFRKILKHFPTEFKEITDVHAVIEKFLCEPIKLAALA